MKNRIVVLAVAALLMVVGCAEEETVGVGGTGDGTTNAPYNPNNTMPSTGTPTTPVVTPVTTPNAEGNGGEPCFENGTCNGDLECVNGTCQEKEAGNLGGPCFGNGTCNDGLVCVDNVCLEPASQPQGGAGGECYPNGTCNAPNECVDGVCVPPTCQETSCDTDIDCALCLDEKTTCLLEENRCVACDPNTNAGCELWEECTSNGICEEVSPPCPTTEDGTPTITCTSNADCAGCSPMNRVCDLETNRCVACTDTNTQNCLATDYCYEGLCSSQCPHECSEDGECSQCEVNGIQANACFAHKCAECSDTYPCMKGKNCINGVCVPACGLPGAVAGTCTEDTDCVYCGGNSSGVLTSATWGCNKPVNGATYGTCGPPAAGCSDLGNGIVVLPSPWDAYTQTCSNDTDCAGVGVNYNVGKLLKGLVGNSVMGVDIQDAIVLYEMNICAELEITGNVSCGICVPCAKDADCNPINLDPLLFSLLGNNILAQIAVQFLLNQLFPDENAGHNMYFFCEPVAAGYGVCAPCTNPSQACGSSSGGSSGGGELPTGSCDHNVCEMGAALGSNCGDCEASVCGADPYCCENQWDATCVNEVEDYCTVSCNGGQGGEGGATGGGPVTTCNDPCVEGDAMKAECSSCVATVCSDDPFCCNETSGKWDGVCVNAAQDVTSCSCDGGATTEGGSEEEGGSGEGAASGGGPSDCAPGCPGNWIGDGLCDVQCNVAACQFDSGDCDDSGDECDSSCPENWIGDNYCDTACNNGPCQFDGGDCEVDDSGDGEDANGIVPADCYDEDCLIEWIADDYCDPGCNNSGCNFDNGDCP